MFSNVYFLMGVKACCCVLKMNLFSRRKFRHLSYPLYMNTFPKGYIIFLYINSHLERVISINKNVVQSSRYKNWYASKAVDGKYITHHPYRCECCSGTKYEQDPWLKVDLGPNHEISRIVIYGRTDGSYSNRKYTQLMASIHVVIVSTQLVASIVIVSTQLVASIVIVSMHFILQLFMVELMASIVIVSIHK